MVISDCTVGMGITGSFCSFEKTKNVAKRLVDSFTHVTPVYSYNAQMMNTRFGKAGDFMHTISEITGDEGIRTLQEDRRLLHQLLARELTPREADVLRRRYGLDGHLPQTQRQVAAHYGISRSYVSRIEKKALHKLEEALRDRR